MENKTGFAAYPEILDSARRVYGPDVRVVSKIIGDGFEIYTRNGNKKEMSGTTAEVRAQLHALRIARAVRV